MALQRRGKWYYGDSRTDIRERLLGYSSACGYEAQHFAAPTCTCGGEVFELWIDETEGVAVRVCVACHTRHLMGDSAEYLTDAEPQQCECPCGSDNFELMVGVALYEGSDEVRWIYIGCRCQKCSLTACFGDWKNEFADYRLLLSQV